MLELQWQDNSFYATICLTNKRELGEREICGCWREEEEMNRRVL